MQWRNRAQDWTNNWREAFSRWNNKVILINMRKSGKKRESCLPDHHALSQSLCKLFTADAFEMEWLLCSGKCLFFCHTNKHIWGIVVCLNTTLTPVKMAWTANSQNEGSHSFCMGFVKEELLELLLCCLNVLSTFKKHLQRANNHNRGS